MVYGRVLAAQFAVIVTGLGTSLPGVELGERLFRSNVPPAMSHDLGRFESIAEFRPQIDNARPSVERARAEYDLTHSFKFNH